jgi:hypothetical protein
VANTYQLIASNTLSTTAASVTFSSIPGTYTDLVLKMSVRTSNTGVTYNNLLVTFNGASSGYSRTRVYGDGATAASSRSSNQAYFIWTFGSDSADATSNTFANNELYIPSYTASQNKPTSLSLAHENNTTTAYITAQADLWSNTAAITSITLDGNSSNFVSGSSFFLYGIKNS